MDYDRDKVDETALALMYLGLHRQGPVVRAWKGYDWEVLDRMYEKGWIGDPKSKAKSVPVTEEGQALADKFFNKYFGAAA